MELHKILRSDRGFTIIEVLIAIAILAIIFSLGLIFSMDFYRTYAFNYEKDLVVGTLQKARSRAMANMFESAHGVAFYEDLSQYIIFRGDSYIEGEASNESTEANKAIDVDFSEEVIFSQLGGSCENCVPEIEVKLSGFGKESIIKINNEGRINY